MLQLQEESIPSLDEANTQEIPTIEITPDAEENAAEIVEENQGTNKISRWNYPRRLTSGISHDHFKVEYGYGSG